MLRKLWELVDAFRKWQRAREIEAQLRAFEKAQEKELEKRKGK